MRIAARLFPLVFPLIFAAGCSSAESSATDDARVDDSGEIDATSDAALDATSDAALDSRAGGDVHLDAIGDSSGCPSDMISIGEGDAAKAFCMDRYEAPNVAGAKPLAFQIAPDGQKWCEGRGKRLCTEAEWVRACNGVDSRPYPYGTTYVRGKCDDDATWIAPSWTTLGTYPSDASIAEAQRLYQADPSGSRTGCVSEEGAFDLTGNVAEWVVRSFPNANNYDHVMKGCYWSGCYGGSPPSCAFVNPAHPGTFRSYEAGFRCCKDR